MRKWGFFSSLVIMAGFEQSHDVALHCVEDLGKSNGRRKQISLWATEVTQEKNGSSLDKEAALR